MLNVSNMEFFGSIVFQKQYLFPKHDFAKTLFYFPQNKENPRPPCPGPPMSTIPTVIHSVGHVVPPLRIRLGRGLRFTRMIWRRSSRRSRLPLRRRHCLHVRSPGHGGHRLTGGLYGRLWYPGSLHGARNHGPNKLSKSCLKSKNVKMSISRIKF